MPYPHGARAPQFPAVECISLTGEKLKTFKTIEAGHCDGDGFPVIDCISEETVRKMPAGARHYVRVISGVMAIRVEKDKVEACQHVLLDELDKEEGWYMAQIVFAPPIGVSFLDNAFKIATDVASATAAAASATAIAAVKKARKAASAVGDAVVSASRDAAVALGDAVSAEMKRRNEFDY